MSIYDLEYQEDLDELVTMLGQSESPAVRSRAAEAIGEVAATEDDDAVETLIRVAVDDVDERVSAAAVDALTEVGGPALDRLIGRIADVEVSPGGRLPTDAYRAVLDHDMPELRMAAANAVGRAAVADAVPALLEHVDDEDLRVRRRVVRAVGQVGDERAIDPLDSLAGDAPPVLRREIAIALGEIGESTALDALLDLVTDESDEVRLAAVKALGQFGSDRPIPMLLERFRDETDEIRQAAAYATVELLSNAPQERSHDIRTTIVDALSATPGSVVTDALVELFEESTEAHQRRNAAWLLGRISGSDGVTIETLVAALDDDDELVRRFAATSLAELDDEAVEAALLDALDTTFGDGRSMLLFTLGMVGSEAARERLLVLLDEVEDVETQERTLSALSRLGGV